MRAFKLIVAALFAVVAAVVALLAGAFAAAVVAAIGLAVYLSRRLLGRPPAAAARTSMPRRRPASDVDAIEVTTTEIASDPGTTAEATAEPRKLPPIGGAPSS